MRNGVIVAALGALSVACLLLAAMLFYVAVRGGTETRAPVVVAMGVVVGLLPAAVFGGLAYVLHHSTGPP